MKDSKKILICDDMQMHLDYLRYILKKEGYKAEIAHNGLDAFDKVRTFAPDLILLDNLMPKMSGKELIEILKKDIVYKSIPIIMFSACENESYPVEAYMPKPIVVSDLLAKIKSLINKSE